MILNLYSFVLVFLNFSYYFQQMKKRGIPQSQNPQLKRRKCSPASQKLFLSQVDRLNEDYLKFEVLNSAGNEFTVTTDNKNSSMF